MKWKALSLSTSRVLAGQGWRDSVELHGLGKDLRVVVEQRVRFRGSELNKAVPRSGMVAEKWKLRKREKGR